MELQINADLLRSVARQEGPSRGNHRGEEEFVALGTAVQHDRNHGGVAGGGILMTPNFAFDRPASSHSLAAAGQRER